MLAVLGLDRRERLGAVGGERVVLPTGQQLTLGVEGADAADDQAPACEGGLGDLGDARRRVVLQGLPGRLLDLFNGGPDVGLHAHPDRELPARLLEPVKRLVGPKPRVGPQQLGPLGAGAVDPGDQLVAEAQHPARGVRRALATADVDHLAGVRARSEDRVITALAGIAKGGALLGIAVHLADERVDIDCEPPVTRPGAGRPRTLKRLAKDSVELADMAERKGAQERAQRRRRDDVVAEHLPGPAGSKQIAVIDAVRAQRHRRDQGHHLGARIGRPRAVTEIDAVLDERLDPKPLSERRGQHDPRIRHHPLVIEHRLHTVQSDRPVNMHHEGDLLRGPRLPSTAVKKPCSGGHSSIQAGQNTVAAPVDPGLEVRRR